MIWSFTALRPATAGGVLALALLAAGQPAPVMAQDGTATVQRATLEVPGAGRFQMALAEALAGDPELLTFYRLRGFAGLWSTAEAAERRNAALAAFASAADHALPPARYDAEGLMALLRETRTPEAQAAAEVALSRALIRYASDLQSGLLVPSEVDADIHRDVFHRPPLATLQGYAQAAHPASFLRGLAPASGEYARLTAAKGFMERVIAGGGWGPEVPVQTLRPGDSGAGVAALRDRLVAMGYLAPTSSPDYDAALRDAVLRFQQAHGLDTDGTAGPSTLGMLNVGPEERLRSILVAMERERWLSPALGDRHVWVNLTDFNVRLVEKGDVIFRTRSVVGADASDRRSPEFSDVMEYMVVNPTWNVPRSIVTKEFLPQLQSNRYAVSNLEIVDRQGRVVDRQAVDFRQFTQQSFPFSMREPPSQGNALGLVKFMFPNPYNIYLHDTPAKSLFGREIRAYSHGCIRLGDPFEFAYALLAPQVDDPEGFFRARLDGGREQRVNLETPVPVHIVYRTAFTEPGAPLQFRRDVYGRDARIWEALAREGVATPGAGG